MYTHYFGLAEKPFAIAPNPRYLYMSQRHREALAHLLYGINSGGCIILLTGDVGTGKTTLCRSLIEQLSDKTDVAIVLNPKLTITDLLKTLCDELKIHFNHSAPTVKTYVDRLNEFLIDAHAKGRNTVLIIDEAQNLDREILEQLRLLTNLETDTHKLLQIVLIGQPELRDLLNHPALSQINQRITTRYHLKPLREDDVSSYIHHRLAVAGATLKNALFTTGAMRYIARSSKGIPRRINLLCDHSLLGAYSGDKEYVDKRTVKKAIREITGGRSRKFFSSGRVFVLALLSLLTIIVPAIIYFSLHPEQMPFTLHFNHPHSIVISSEVEVIDSQPISTDNK